MMAMRYWAESVGCSLGTIFVVLVRIGSLVIGKCSAKTIKDCGLGLRVEVVVGDEFTTAI
jgi:hypothetical protein